MAHSHYVMDLYFRDPAKPDKVRRDALRIEAENDEAAVAEAKRVDGWKNTDWFHLRAIGGSAKTSHRLIFDSQPPEAEGDAAAGAP